MAEIKDKVVTAESLKALHDYNTGTYETKTNVENLLSEKFDKPEDNIIPIENGGTGSADGVTGLANLFASGYTVLSTYQYGDEFPENVPVGTIFFKRLQN